jgi:hypothetical protein
MSANPSPAIASSRSLLQKVSRPDRPRNVLGTWEIDVEDLEAGHADATPAVEEMR